MGAALSMTGFVFCGSGLPKQLVGLASALMAAPGGAEPRFSPGCSAPSRRSLSWSAATEARAEARTEARIEALQEAYEYVRGAGSDEEAIQS